MRRMFAAVVVLAMVTPAGTFAAPRTAAQAPTGTGAVQGTATASTGEALPNYTVQIRNLANGQLAGSTTSNAAGSFSFAGLNPGNYVIEVVNQAGAIVGSSAATAVTAGATVTVSVSATAAAAIAATGAAAAAGGAATGGVSTAVIVTTAAAAAGVAGAVAVAVNEASPSR